MSVCMNLYKIVPDVTYIGKPTDKVKWSVEDSRELDKLEESLGYRDDFTYEEVCEWQDKIDAAAWSDGVAHEMIDLVYIRGLHRVGKGGRLDRCWKQTFNKLSQFKLQSFRNENGKYYQYIPVDSIVYRQGWFLRKSFFNKKSWYFVATDKKQMMNFFDRYFDHSERAIEARKALEDAWQDGMVYVCSW